EAFAQLEIILPPGQSKIVLAPEVLSGLQGVPKLARERLGAADAEKRRLAVDQLAQLRPALQNFQVRLRHLQGPPPQIGDLYNRVDGIAQATDEALQLAQGDRDRAVRRLARQALRTKSPFLVLP